MTQFGKTLRFFRTEYGYTQKDLARRARINPQQIYNVESGRVGIPLKHVRRVLKAFGRDNLVRQNLKRSLVADYKAELEKAGF